MVKARCHLAICNKLVIWRIRKRGRGLAFFDRGDLVFNTTFLESMLDTAKIGANLHNIFNVVDPPDAFDCCFFLLLVGFMHLKLVSLQALASAKWAAMTRVALFWG